MWLQVALGNGMSMLKRDGKGLLLSACSGIKTNLSSFVMLEEGKLSERPLWVVSRSSD